MLYSLLPHGTHGRASRSASTPCGTGASPPERWRHAQTATHARTTSSTSSSATVCGKAPRLGVVRSVNAGAGCDAHRTQSDRERLGVADDHSWLQ
eukprot:6026891-Prymnesium_polylepis.2